MATMTTPSVLAIVQAGGQGSRMDVLTRERAKPAMPFAGTHRLIDFALSSLAHSGIGDVWVSVQYQAGSLDTHLAGGRPWDLDRTRGGLRRMVPEQDAGAATQTGFSRGNADDLYRIADAIGMHAPDLVVVTSSDHVFALDLRAVIARHRELEAECTIVTAEVDATEGRNNVVVVTDRSGRVTEAVDKPDRPPASTVATEIFVYDRVVLLEVLERLRREVHPGDGSDDTGLGDFADHLLPDLISRGRVHAYPMERYWRDVGRPEAYLGAHRDLLQGRLDLLDDPSWPVLGQHPDGPPARIVAGSRVADSLLSPGCVVRGTVERSVVGPGVEVAAGAHVVDSVLFRDVVVDADARVETAVVDERVRIGRGAVVGAAPAGGGLREQDVTLLGPEAVVQRGARLGPGARMEPGSIT